MGSSWPRIRLRALNVAVEQGRVRGNGDANQMATRGVSLGIVGCARRERMGYMDGRREPRPHGVATVKCLNCGQLARFHGDPNLPAGDQSVCGDYEPDHEAVAEQAEWHADMVRPRESITHLWDGERVYILRNGLIVQSAKLSARPHGEWASMWETRLLQAFEQIALKSAKPVLPITFTEPNIYTVAGGM